jgi:hypothetical protein
VLVSAGVGATPLLAMLGGLAARASEREVWWLHAARSRAEHAFAGEADFYVCGPTAFMREIAAGLVAWGVPGERILIEEFGPSTARSAATLRAPHLPAGAPGDGPPVSFARAGLTVPWNDWFCSLLELAEACDVPADWSCRTGVCHRCETGLVDGDVTYEPEPLDPWLPRSAASRASLVPRPSRAAS